MISTTLGRSGLEISVLGLGTWAIGGGEYEFGWGPQDDDDSEEMIKAALDAGLNWIDTAPAYGLGRAERVIGRALEQRDTRPLIFTKCSRLWNDDGTFYSSLKPDSIRRELEGSLSRLRLDSVDLYQIHRPWPAEDLAEGWKTLARLKEEGLVAHIGVSYVTAEDLEMLETIAPVEVVQPEYNLLQREIERFVLPWCHEHHTGVIAYSPMASGLLTGAFTRQRVDSLADDDWRKHAPPFNAPALSGNLAIAEVLGMVARSHGCSPGEAAIAWVLANESVQGAIVGFRNPAQVHSLANAAEVELSADELSLLDDATRQPWAR